MTRTIFPRRLPGSARAAALVALVGGAACDPPPPDDEEPVAPVARMFFPQFALAGTPALFDARASSDENKDPLTFSLNPGDGTPAAESPDGTFAHVYDAPGTFEVELIVSDSTGESASAFGDVVVVTDDASCSCELACFDDALCTPRGCEALASSEDGDEGAPADALACD